MVRHCDYYNGSLTSLGRVALRRVLGEPVSIGRGYIVQLTANTHRPCTCLHRLDLLPSNWKNLIRRHAIHNVLRCVYG